MANSEQSYNLEEVKFLRSIGRNLRNCREKRGLSQHQLSVEALLPKNQIGRIERAEINTSIITLKRICNALNVDMKDLLKD